jgi:sigma-B regulation protein RsbU (phosphoserine phosphatase)
MTRDRILVLLEHRGNRRLLVELLEGSYEAVAGDSETALRSPFDLCITDGMMLARMFEAIRARRLSEQGVFLPILLATSGHDAQSGLRRVWENVDEFISVPIKKSELTTRVEMLLRARRLSRQNFELRRALEVELEHAARVQASLLPAQAPNLSGFEVAARCLPAREVGGDFYDWEETAPGTFSFTLGDVSGKGMPAALLMATIRGTLRAVSRQNGPAEALGLAQRALEIDFERAGRFVTLFHGRLDLRNADVRFVDAGHGHVFMRRADGSIESLQPRMMPFGAFLDEGFDEGVMNFSPGDALIVYSDGLTEIHHDSVLDSAGLAARIDHGASAQEMIDCLLELAPPSVARPDDLTVMVIRRAQ